MPNFSSDYILDCERLRGAPFVLVWAVILAACEGPEWDGVEKVIVRPEKAK